jgi:hypothetical protein
MTYINRGQVATISFIARNDRGYVIDLDGASIILSLKSSATSETNIFQKNGNILNAERGLFSLYLTATDTANLQATEYTLEISINSGEYVYFEVIRLKPFSNIVVDNYKRYGTTSDIPTLPNNQYIGFTFTNTETEVISVWNGTSWISLAGSTELSAHISDTSNPHEVTKTQVGLSNVDNTSDADKPVSDATQTAIDDATDNTYYSG